MPLLLCALAGLILLIAFWFWGQKANAALDQLPVDYQIVPSLLTPHEAAWKEALMRNLPPGTILLAKVRLIDVIHPKNPKSQAARNRVISKHLDFLLVDSATWTPMAAIEIDDSSHRRPDRQKRDRFLEEACESAGLRLVRLSGRPGTGAINLAA